MRLHLAAIQALSRSAPVFENARRRPFQENWRGALTENQIDTESEKQQGNRD